MRKWNIFLTSLALLILLPMTTRAAQTVTIGAANVTAEAGQTISVPVTIRGNSGFTNFSLTLGYDEKALELLELKAGGLCPELTRVNGSKIVSARANVVEKNGVLATAVFKVREGYAGTATVTPTVDYFRCAEETGTFQTLTVNATSGSVRVDKTGEDGTGGKPEGTASLGDVNGDGRINALDAALVYGHLAGMQNLTSTQLARADVDGNGIVDRSDAIWLYRYVTNRITAFPKATEGDQS